MTTLRVLAHLDFTESAKRLKPIELDDDLAIYDPDHLLPDEDSLKAFGRLPVREKPDKARQHGQTE
ncbi:MAG: hypothetical protein KGO02_02905 [Alphaproteobacteria bacterium]|nr:hypothetical protein [Alphaproteobacteria bacterium]